jgi:protein-disulfide isomerase
VPGSTLTRREARAAARGQRLERERAVDARLLRARRLRQLAGVAAVAAIAVIALVVISQAGKSKPSTGGPLRDVAAVNVRFTGIPQHGTALGNPSAPVTLVEFADLQCPFCRQFASAALPTLVDRYVRSGKLRIEFRNLAFIGPDSRTAAQAAAGAAQQNRLWPFIDLFYANQGEENTGYVTSAFLRKVASGVRGLDAARALRDGAGAQAPAQLAQAQTLATRNGVSSTPSFLLGRTGGALRALNVTSLSAGSFTGPIDKVAA